MGAFSGLGGYVGKGFGALGGGRTGPAVIGTSLSQGELLVMRESASRGIHLQTVHLLTVRLPPRHHATTDHGVFVDGEGNVSRETVIDWTVPPEDLGAFMRVHPSEYPSA
jgi:hypothetical protein